MTLPLHEPLYYLAVESRDSAQFVTVRSPNGTALPLFRDEDLARRHAHAAGAAVHTVAADDLRAREDLLTAALASGTALVWLDPSQDGTTYDELLTARALNLVLSYKNQAACM